MRRLGSHGAGDGVDPLWRAVLLLPLVAGVVAMHVLLLCAAGGSGSDPMASHSGHGSSHPAAAPATPATPATSDLPAVDAPAPDHAGHVATSICLAVLVALAALLLAGPAGGVRRSVDAAGRGVLERVPMPRPPPRGDLAILLCVSRT